MASISMEGMEGMEGLGTILRRTTSERKQNLTPDENSLLLEIEAAQQDTCAICHGGGWVSRTVPVGHADFGEMFRCRCQTEADAAVKISRLAAHANLPHAERPRSFENFDPRTGAIEALSAAVAFGATVRALTLVGNKGSGKSHLLEAIGRSFLAAGRSVRYEHCGDLLDRLRAGSADDAEISKIAVIAECKGVALLILDDLGMDSPTTFGMGEMSKIIDYRIREGHCLVVGTNLIKRQIALAVDVRVADRLFDMQSFGTVECVVMTCDSYRTGDR